MKQEQDVIFKNAVKEEEKTWRSRKARRKPPPTHTKGATTPNKTEPDDCRTDHINLAKKRREHRKG